MLAVWLELSVDEDFESVKAKADAGDTRAQFNLGERYAGGEGVPKDKNEAVKWYHKAAEQGLADAQFCLGKCYEEAVKVEDHGEQAVKWFRKAAEQGHAEAQFCLGQKYSFGILVNQDGKEADKWAPETKETADHSLPYIVAVSLMDGEITVQRFDKSHLQNPKLLELVNLDEDRLPILLYIRI